MMNMKTKDRYKYIGGVVILAITVFSVFSLARTKPEMHLPGSKTAMKDTISGLKNGAEVNVSLLKPSLEVLPLDVEKGVGNDFEVKVGQPLPSSYRLSYFLNEMGQNLNNITIDINKARGAAQVSLNGFEPRQPFSLLYNNSFVEKDVPSDWSGRIQFDVSLTDVPVLLCVDWLAVNGEASLCHMIGGKEAA